MHAVSIPAGTLLEMPFPLNGFGPDAFGLLPSEDLIVGEGNQLSRINDAGARHLIAPSSPGAQWRLISDSNGAISAGIGDDFVAELDSAIVRVNKNDRIVSRVPVPGDVKWLAVDRFGTTWIWMNNSGVNGHIYAIDEASETATLLEGLNENPDGLFLGADGSAYALAGADLLRLTVNVIPNASVLPGRLQMKCPGGYTGLPSDATAVRGVGPDGSVWGSSPTVIMHRHRDGRTVCLRFHSPLMAISIPPNSLHFRIANDGSAWLNAGQSSFIRISPDDRVFDVRTQYEISSSAAVASTNDLWYWSSSRHALIRAHIGLPRSYSAPDVSVWKLPTQTSGVHAIVDAGSDPIRFLVRVDPGATYYSNLVDMYTGNNDNLLRVSSLPIAPDTLLSMTSGSGPWSGWLGTSSRILRDDYNPHQILSVSPDTIVAMESAYDHSLWIARKAHSAPQATTLLHVTDAHQPRSPQIDDIQDTVPDIVDLRLGADRIVYARDGKGNLYQVRVHARPVAVFHGICERYAVASDGSVWFIRNGTVYHNSGHAIQSVTGISAARAMAALRRGAVWVAAGSELCDVSAQPPRCSVLPAELSASALFPQQNGTIWLATDTLIARFRP